MSTRHVDPLAATYAEVLGSVAFERGGAELAQEVGEALSALGQVWADERELRAFFLSAMVDEEEKEQAFRKLLGTLPELLQDFVRLCIRRQRGRMIDKIAVAYQAYLDDRLGRVPVTLVTAKPVPEDMVRAWTDRLRAATGREPVLEHVVKPELIAGAQMRVGNVVIDGSARRRLADLQKRVRERGKHAVQA